MSYDLNYGDEKSDRYYVIKMLENEKEDVKKWIKSCPLNSGKGLDFIFISSDPTELVDRLNLLYQEKMIPKKFWNNSNGW